jgi:hypothetical protein
MNNKKTLVREFSSFSSLRASGFVVVDDGGAEGMPQLPYLAVRGWIPRRAENLLVRLQSFVVVVVEEKEEAEAVTTRSNRVQL